jgi:predicted nucleic acid-binding protein
MWFFKSRSIELSRAKIKIEEYLTNEKSLFSGCTADDVRFATNVKNYKNYNDYLILSAAKRLEQPLFSFDDELEKIARKNAVRMTKK